MVLGMLQQSLHLWAHHGVNGIEGAEEHDVVGLYVGIFEVEMLMRCVTVEHIVGLIALVEERQRHGRLAVGVYVHVVGIHAVVSQKTDYIFAHAVVARLRKEGARHTGTAQRNDETTGDADGRCMMRSPLGSIAVLYCVISCQFLRATNCYLSAFYSSLFLLLN